MKRIGNRSFEFENNTCVLSSAGVVGPKEAEGPLGKCFDQCFDDSILGQKSWEKAESILQKSAVSYALLKGDQKPEEIDVIFAGDLLNQCIASSFGLMSFDIPLVGTYGACSTMALTTINAGVYVDSGAVHRAVAVTSSHFCSAERQYRYPLEYGGVRPPTSQWTVTGAGALLLGRGAGVQLKRCTVGKIIDLGVKDANNMGAAMAPDDVKIRPYLKGVGIWNLDLFSGVIFAVAALNLLEMPTHEGMVFFYLNKPANKGVKST